MAILYIRFQFEICKFYISFGIYIFVYSIIQLLMNIFSFVAFRLKHAMNIYLNYGLHIIRLERNCVFMPTTFKKRHLEFYNFQYKCCGLNNSKD
ncbi:hypothetical protein HZS_6567 [Henneguya salminicola]|nr:hypothetical protein HZS_6567 [Henneguya salminicola]